ncbi:hypothetical protein HXZ94_15715 [Empedobacter falsenii]|uniref:hypothetical protein n=1 Tax=Empedobacter falsenii TaxID=343874 RepID=UPI002574BAEA|nr:hypothetical protein [Empedobacter falsenii]MDM1299942.1 hypothetical protein [Empedobacter falsenii]MDM1319735.1 hypothetical protein [Empedobacter falsenii]
MSETSILLLFLLSMFFIPMICIGIHEYYLEEKEKPISYKFNKDLYYKSKAEKCKRCGRKLPEDLSESCVCWED